MMDTTISVLIRTTSCTMLAATMALIFIRIARIQSPRVHRAIWVLVLLQGWVFVPVAVGLPVDVLPIETAVMIAEVPHAGSVEVAVTDGIGAGTNVQQRESTATKVTGPSDEPPRLLPPLLQR